jgi:hypothetical protein
LYVDVPKSEQQGEGEAIPFDDAHKHFGKGQTAADLELSPVSLDSKLLSSYERSWQGSV